MPAIIVTGATGCIGHELVPQLISDGWDVVALGRKQSRWELLPGDVRTLEWNGDVDALIAEFRDIAPTAVVHLATQFVGEHQPGDIDAMVESNIRFGAHVAEATAHVGSDLTFLNIGTVWQHADGSEYSPTNLYAATKEAFVDILRYYSELEKFRVFNLELTDSYGPEDSRRKIWSVLIDAAKNGDSLQFPPGDALIDPIYVTDVVQAISTALGLAQQSDDFWQAYQVAGETFTVKELVKHFEQVTGSSLDIAWGAVPYRARERFSDWSYLPPLPGWQQQVLLDEGIARLWKAAQ